MWVSHILPISAVHWHRLVKVFDYHEYWCNWHSFTDVKNILILLGFITRCRNIGSLHNFMFDFQVMAIKKALWNRVSRCFKITFAVMRKHWSAIDSNSLHSRFHSVSDHISINVCFFLSWFITSFHSLILPSFRFIDPSIYWSIDLASREIEFPSLMIGPWINLKLGWSWNLIQISSECGRNSIETFQSPR